MEGILISAEASVLKRAPPVCVFGCRGFARLGMKDGSGMKAALLAVATDPTRTGESNNVIGKRSRSIMVLCYIEDESFVAGFKEY